MVLVVLIQMPFNRLIAGVRSDVPIKVFGDDLDQLATTADEVVGVMSSTDASRDAQTEKVTGLPFIQIAPGPADADLARAERRRCESVVSTAMGGTSAEQMFEGDRRFDIVVRPHPATT